MAIKGMMVSIAAAKVWAKAMVDLNDAVHASNEIGDVKLAAVQPLAVSDVVQDLPDPHGGSRRLLFGQVPLPEFLVPGPVHTFHK